MDILSLNEICLSSVSRLLLKKKKIALLRGFPGGRVDKNPPANAGDKSSIPGLGTFHMPRSN